MLGHRTDPVRDSLIAEVVGTDTNRSKWETLEVEKCWEAGDEEAPGKGDVLLSKNAPLATLCICGGNQLSRLILPSTRVEYTLGILKHTCEKAVFPS